MLRTNLLPTRPEALRGLLLNLRQVVSSPSPKPKIKMEPDNFLRTWIPKLYGIEPGEPLYKKACITELRRQVDDTVTYGTIERVWNWEGDKQYFPKYLPVLLRKAHTEYQIKDFLGCLPKYSVDREAPTEN